ncbi:uncharacterized protein BJ171DRAFT_472500 [Polychytrium aggregatum]|uniref:uncharacterized protein n=1 Tax=Polychytrium aggregatum TaxID=110093 RepID=UPI0022FDEBF5|nr:uncharacterized protein BJ171DRAFT_472500 [Polychytrium aggregatum]KAI9207644.1 hypothetical protein BJ171DRAFT_472500 [Polychytrium aggregatum]
MAAAVSRTGLPNATSALAMRAGAGLLSRARLAQHSRGTSTRQHMVWQRCGGRVGWLWAVMGCDSSAVALGALLGTGSHTALAHGELRESAASHKSWSHSPSRPAGPATALAALIESARQARSEQGRPRRGPRRGRIRASARRKKTRAVAAVQPKSARPDSDCVGKPAQHAAPGDPDPWPMA